ncbi:MAG: CDP-alcohol phosphatidyltransferase family protein [Gemmatimonadales bacterium]
MTTVEEPVRGAVLATGAPWLDLGAALVLTVVTAAATWRVLGLEASYLAIAVGLHLGMGALLLAGLTPEMRAAGFGAANRITLTRAVLAMPVLALALLRGPLDDATRWWIIGLGTVVVLLDGLDGRVARATRTETPFGARFDMELDAALLMALSLLVWRDGRVGVWVLLIGLMRYVFVAAGWFQPALARELPPSFRRKVVCVVQGVALLVALGPIVPAPMALLACAAALAALVHSFAVDVRWALGAEGAGPRR